MPRRSRSTPQNQTKRERFPTTRQHPTNTMLTGIIDQRRRFTKLHFKIVRGENEVPLPPVATTHLQGYTIQTRKKGNKNTTPSGMIFSELIFSVRNRGGGAAQTTKKAIWRLLRKRYRRGELRKKDESRSEAFSAPFFSAIHCRKIQL